MLLNCTRLTKLPLSLLCLMLAALPAPEGRAETTIGPLSPAPALAIYIANDTGITATRLTVVNGAPSTPRRLLVRAFDPDEKLILWRYVEYVDEETLAQVQAPAGVILRPASPPPDDGELLLEEELTLDQPGVYQVRVSTDWQATSARLELDRDMPWGYSCQNGKFNVWDGQPDAMYAYVPPHAEELQINGGPVTVRDQAGKQIAQNPARKDACTIPVTETETVWEVSFPEPGNWQLTAAGFPFILCPTSQSAEAIRASVEVLDDGTVVCHKFQRRIAELLPGLLSEERVGRTEDLVVSLSDLREEWLKEPVRNAILVSSFVPAAQKWLESQNLDPESHWGGSLDGWQGKVDAGPPENRWDRLKSVSGLWGGASSHYGAGAEHMARAALYDSPANPYYGKKELLYRAAAAALRDLMALAEDETWPGTADLDPYPGMMAFVLGQKTLPVYGVTAPHMPPEIREVWTEGLQHIVDRSFCDTLVTCRNQSSHYLVAFEAFAEGSQAAGYETMMELYSRRWVAGQHPTGYHMERCGPDASYIGMTHWHEAVYYRMSGDPLVLDSLRRSYRFFNHTVGPEPDGKMLGGFNFNHRIGEGFYFEQWGGATGILDDVLPEVGVWAGREPTEEQQAEAESNARRAINRFMDKPTHPLYPDQTTWRYLWYREPDRSGVFPCQEPGAFIRQFGDELVAVKRPAYYAVCYTGKPVSDYYVSDRVNFREPYPDDAESTGGYLPSTRKITPFVGGGLSGFWTPEYGHGLLAANWSPATHHGLIATRQDGLRYWEDYHAHTYTLDEDAGTLTIAGQIEDVPVRYTRKYEFAETEVRVELVLEADADVKLLGLVENMPLARGGWKARGAEMTAGGEHRGKVTADEFTIGDDRGAGMQVLLDKPRELTLVPEGLQTPGWRKLQIGRVAIALPATMSAGEKFELSYSIRPVVPQD